MDDWRQGRLNELNRALDRIRRRADRVVHVIDILHAESQRQQQQEQEQRRRQQQLDILSSELSRLQDMSDRLSDFKDRLYFYSNLGYVESLNEWQYEIRKICVKAEGFSQRAEVHRHHREHPHNHQNNHQNHHENQLQQHTDHHHRRRHHHHHHHHHFAGLQHDNNDQHLFEPLPLLS